MNDYRPRFLVALKAHKQALGRPLRHDEILDVCHLTAEILIGEAVKEAKSRKAKKVELSDEEWVVSLEAEPALKGINVRQEIGRAQFWCKQNKRIPTRRFLVNWLNKAEKVVDLKAMGATHATGLKLPAPDGPSGWLPWLNTELSLLSEDHSAHGQLLAALNCRSFSMMPNSWRARCIQQLQQKSG